MQKKKSNEGSGMNEYQLGEVASLFKVLSEPARLQLISSLMPGGLTVGELVAKTGLKQGNVSKHMKILFESSLVAKLKEGNYVRYSISEPLLYDLCALVCTQLENAAHERLKQINGQ